MGSAVKYIYMYFSNPYNQMSDYRQLIVFAKHKGMNRKIQGKYYEGTQEVLQKSTRKALERTSEKP